jgi:hypothetical protein
MTLKGEDGELELMERVLKHTQQVLLHVYLILIIFRASEYWVLN